MKLVVLSEPEWIKYPFIVHRHLNAALEFAQAIDETLTVGWLEGYETGAVVHASDWYLRRRGVGGYEDVEPAMIYPNTRWMYEDTPQLVLAFMGPSPELDDPVSRTFQMAHQHVYNGVWVKFIDLPVTVTKDPQAAPSAMDVVHGKLVA